MDKKVFDLNPLSPFISRSADGCGKFTEIRADGAKGAVTQEVAESLEDT